MNFNSRGFIGTSIFHGFILLVFALTAIKMTAPLPGDQGLLINFGDSETGLGNEEPMLNDYVSVKLESKTKPVRSLPRQDKPVVTQNFEEAPAMTNTKKPVKKNIQKKKEKTTPIIEKQDTKNEAPKIDLPKVNKQALYRGRKTGTSYTGSEGVAGGQGNQGSLAGSENSTNHSLNGGGSGGGTSVSLAGRNSISLPPPVNDYQKEGKVVVEIRVDRQGNVVSAVPGIKGSTTLDNYLCSVAKKAALSSKFDANQNAPNQQVGTISYIFKLK
jgi:outer membrane biosynthesis protein TonB